MELQTGSCKGGLPGGQIWFIQHIHVCRLVVIHKVAVGQVGEVLAVAVSAEAASSGSQQRAGLGPQHSMS